MTSGMSAKGSALGTSVPESAAPPNRAPAPRASGNTGNGDGRGNEAQTATDPKDSAAGGTGETEGTFAGSIGAESVPPAVSSSVRTLILGIDYDGRIVQYDRNVPRILAREADELLGAQLSDLTVRGAQSNSHAARPVDGVAAVSGLLEAIRSDREGSTMLTIETRDGHPAEAVVTVYPMRAGGTSIADTLDIDHLARELMDALVPHFCNAGELLLLESLIGNDELPAHGPDGSLPVRR